MAICPCRWRSTTCGSRPDYPRLIESMERYEFKSLLQDVRDEAARAGTQTQGELLL